MKARMQGESDARQAANVISRKIRKLASAPPPNKELDWVPLVADDDDDKSASKEDSHESLRATDQKRKHLLNLARNTLASSTLFKIWQLPRTVLPRLAKKPVVWLVLLCFAAGSVLSRRKILSDVMHDETHTYNDTIM